MRFSPPTHIPMEGSTIGGLNFERLKKHHCSVLLRNPSIYRGPHRNTQGGGLSDAQLRTKVFWSHEDWRQYESGGLPGGHYWLVRKGETPIAIAGLHTNDRSGSIFIHRMYLSPGHSEETKISIIKTTVTMFLWLRPEQLCVQTNSPTPSIYRKAGFELLSQGHMYRQTQPQRSRRKRPMCFLIMPLVPGPLASIEASWTRRPVESISPDPSDPGREDSGFKDMDDGQEGLICEWREERIQHHAPWKKVDFQSILKKFPISSSPQEKVAPLQA